MQNVTCHISHAAGGSGHVYCQLAPQTLKRNTCENLAKLKAVWAVMNNDGNPTWCFSGTR
eukprot:1581511-Amphidinium_carterae.1